MQQNHEHDTDKASAEQRRLPYTFAKIHQVLAHEQDSVVALEFVPPLQPEIASEIKRFFNKPLVVQEITTVAFQKALSQAYERDKKSAMASVEKLTDTLDLEALAESLPKTADLLEQEDDAPVISLINALLSEAVKEGASDIHIEPFEDYLNIRFRVDGVLRQVLSPDRLLAGLIVSRVKVMARLDIAEKRVPQDGRMAIRVAGRTVDIRVSTLPSNHGERVVLRLLDKEGGRLDLSELGMQDDDIKRIERIIKKPHGIVLVTGPTGSGKSTSLYAMLSNLNHESRNILTVEDPIEYDLEGIGQTQINTKVDMTFARGLRAILRQDPDVVMVGEIRDKETADIAVQASLTGHLVFSTLHTNTAIGAIVRLQDMGVEPFLLSSSLVAVMAQRLVRKLCGHCKAPYTPDSDEKALFNQPDFIGTLYHANGCDACGGTGFHGRLGIYEVVPIEREIQNVMHHQVTEQALEALARQSSASIREDGWRKMVAGLTSSEEVLRVTRES